MDRHVGLDLVRITESAGLACARWMGRGDKNAADQAAVTAMRKAFDNVDIRGTVVIGEGERDEAPMLYIGEQVGSGWGPEVDIALDPLECTNSVAYGRPNAMSVIALAARGHFLHAPDTYMEKIAVGPKAKDAIDLARPIEANLEAVAAAKGYHLEDLTVVVLDRPRHEELIHRIRRTGARIHLIPDGDVSAAIARRAWGSRTSIGSTARPTWPEATRSSSRRPASPTATCSTASASSARARKPIRWSCA